MIFEATDLYYLPNLTNIRERGYFCRYFCKYKKQILYFLMTEGFQTFYSITILRTDISSSRTKPAGHSGSEGTDSLRKESDQKLATL